MPAPIVCTPPDGQLDQLEPDSLLQRATLIFVGVIEDEQLTGWPPFILTMPHAEADRDYWRVLHRTVRIETILRGADPRPVIDVYEIFGVGGTSGDWNSTWDGERALFLVRNDHGRYHLVQDWTRNIFPVTTGPHPRLPLDDSHPRLPLDDSHPLWERIALMNWWIPRDAASLHIPHPGFSYNDPGRALSAWRKIKIERGLLRHPSQSVRVNACRDLLFLGGWLQDECWEMLSDSDRSHLSDGGYFRPSAAEIAETRLKKRAQPAAWWWRRYRTVEDRRIMTAVSDRELRAAFGRLWEQDYPNDYDNGCPADRPPPATIVTAEGDLPLRLTSPPGPPRRTSPSPRPQ